jgi:hypothetical protein
MRRHITQLTTGQNSRKKLIVVQETLATTQIRAMFGLMEQSERLGSLEVIKAVHLHLVHMRSATVYCIVQCRRHPFAIEF